VTPARLEPAIPESERPQTHTLDHTATAIGFLNNFSLKKLSIHQGDLCNTTPYPKVHIESLNKTSQIL